MISHKFIRVFIVKSDRKCHLSHHFLSSIGKTQIRHRKGSFRLIYSEDQLNVNKILCNNRILPNNCS